MGARRIQRAMKAQIAPPKAAVEARTCAWAGRATSRGERSRVAGLAPPAERCERPVARFGLDPPGGLAADGTAGRAPGGRRGRDRRQGRKSHSESGCADPGSSFNDRDDTGHGTGGNSFYSFLLRGLCNSGSFSFDSILLTFALA